MEAGFEDVEGVHDLALRWGDSQSLGLKVGLGF
ncbi:hypothetical protein EMIT0232MI5_10537 [Pseudomonas sp. IT-232MI5]